MVGKWLSVYGSMSWLENGVKMAGKSGPWRKRCVKEEDNSILNKVVIIMALLEFSESLAYFHHAR